MKHFKWCDELFFDGDVIHPPQLQYILFKWFLCPSLNLLIGRDRHIKFEILIKSTTDKLVQKCLVFQRFLEIFFSSSVFLWIKSIFS